MPRHWTLAATGLFLAASAAACSANSIPPPPAAKPSHPADPSPTASAPGADLTLQITPAPYQLPSGIAREVVLAQGTDLLVLGGLTNQGATTSEVTRVDSVTGRATPAGRLAAPTHDAAGAVLGGQPVVFGGGSANSIATVQALTGRRGSVAGQLPEIRSDLSAVTLGNTAYLLGGYDGTTWNPRVLATTDGAHFRTVARLPVPVRYAAVAGLGDQIWVFGGEVPSGSTNVIQQVDLGTGKASVVGHLPGPLSAATAFTLGGEVFVAGGTPPGNRPTSDQVFAYDPAGHRVHRVGKLPVPVSNAAVAVVGSTAFLVGGSDGPRQVPAVTEMRLVSVAAAVTPGASAVGAADMAGPGGETDRGSTDASSADVDPAGAAAPADTAAPAGTAGPAGTADPPGEDPAGASGAASGSLLSNAPWLGPPHGKGHLRPGSDPSVLPGDILIADDWNNRLLIVDPQGRVRWRFPRPGDLARGQGFQLPDDAFFSPDGKYIIATEEEYSVVSVISIAKHKIVYRYGTQGVAGSASDFVSNPDDAMMMPNGMLMTADIKNCRLLLLPPWARQIHRPLRIIGQTDSCGHNPPHQFGSPNGAFPATNGDYIVTEINGDWASMMSLGGHVLWSVHPPGVAYPSDTNEVYPGRYLTVDYSQPGQVVEFNTHGRLLWRFGGLNHPSLALPLPNGDILVNDDYNDRVIVIDPLKNRIVWQYGHTGVAGTAPGYLNDPDGVDLAPPDSMLIAHAPTMGEPR